MCQTAKKIKPFHENTKKQQKSPLFFQNIFHFLLPQTNHMPQGTIIRKQMTPFADQLSSRLARIEKYSQWRIAPVPPELFCLCVLSQPLSSSKPVLFVDCRVLYHPTSVPCVVGDRNRFFGVF